MKILNIFKKQSQTFRSMFLYWGGERSIWTPKDYEAFAKEGFQECWIVYSCINAIAKSCAGIPWVLYKRLRNGKLEEIVEHEFLKVWERPNPWMNQSAFIESLVGYYLISGNTYIEKVGPENGTPKELYLLRPDRMKIIPDLKGYVRGYEYSLGTEKMNFLKGEIIHIKSFNPRDDYYGMSPIEAIARIIDKNNQTIDWNKNLLFNDARPPGALVAQGNLTDEQYERLKLQIQETISGAKNAGKPILLEAGLDWKQFAISPKDMDWIQSQKLDLRAIASIYGVPPEMIGDSEQKTYSNYREARQAFYTETILPLLDRFKAEINYFLLPLYGENLELDYNRDEIEAIQEDRNVVWDRAMSAVQRGILTINEAREMLGYEAVDGGDKIYVLYGMVPLGEETEKNIKHFEKKSLEEKKEYLWKQFDKRTREEEKKFKEEMIDFFNEQKKRVLKRIGKMIIDRIEKKLDEDDIWNIDDENEFLKKSGLKGILRAFRSGGKAVMDYLGLDPDLFSLDNPEVQKWIARKVIKFAKEVNETTKEKLKDILKLGNQEGWTITRFADEIEGMFKDMALWRAERIARTEVISAENAGTLEAYRQSKVVEKKGWLGQLDQFIRDSHREADRKYSENPIPIQEPFIVDNEKLMFPGDPSGSPENIINCRCTIYPEIEEE